MMLIQFLCGSNLSGTKQIVVDAISLGFAPSAKINVCNILEWF